MQDLTRLLLLVLFWSLICNRNRGEYNINSAFSHATGSTFHSRRRKYALFICHFYFFPLRTRALNTCNHALNDICGREGKKKVADRYRAQFPRLPIVPSFRRGRKTSVRQRKSTGVPYRANSSPGGLWEVKARGFPDFETFRYSKLQTTIIKVILITSH